MIKKTSFLLFIILNLSILIIGFSPVNYIDYTYTLLHFWLIIIFDLAFLATFLNGEKARKNVRVLSYIIIPVSIIITLSILFLEPRTPYIIKKMKNNYTVRFQSYIVFMAGNPICDIVIEKPLIGDLLFWEVDHKISFDGGTLQQEIATFEMENELK